ncbi:scavenger receptor cysteine-rich domain-containing protein DMBT1-like [Sarcoramphus papa]
MEKYDTLAKKQHGLRHASMSGTIGGVQDVFMGCYQSSLGLRRSTSMDRSMWQSEQGQPEKDPSPSPLGQKVGSARWRHVRCLLSRPLNQVATTLRVQLVEGIFCSSFHPAKTPVLTLLQVPDKGQGTYKLAAAPPPRPAVGISSRRRPVLSNPAGSGIANVPRLRLVGDLSKCAGRVEVFYNNEWGTVCDDNWDLMDAAVVCRQLGCGVALSAPSLAHFGWGVGPIWLDDVSCTGQETDFFECRAKMWGIHNCHHGEDAGVVCAGNSSLANLRLVDGPHRCAGRVEVLHAGQWGTICDDGWDLNDAAVVCRQLGCGRAEAASGRARFGQGTGHIWLDDVACTGSEDNLTQCRARPWGQSNCHHGEDASVVCSDASAINTSTVRLVDGPHRCAGRVEVFHDQQWGTVCDNGWDLSDAAVVCRQLGCGTALSALAGASFGRGLDPIWLDRVACFGGESTLTVCRARPWGINSCTHEEDAGVVCSGDAHSWGVLKAQLGAALPPPPPKKKPFPLQPDPRSIGCRKEISRARGLVPLAGGVGPCPHTPVARGAAPSQAPLAQLSREAGKKDIDTRFGMRAAPRLCWVPARPRKGIYFSPSPSGTKPGGQTAQARICPPIPPWLGICPRFAPRPLPPESSPLPWTCGPLVLNAASPASLPTDLVRAEVAEVRLAEGPNRCGGRVEVLHAGQWGTICDDSWDLNDAAVVCRQLGCGKAIAAPGRARFGQGTGHIWLDDMSCTGSEDNLAKCRARPWGQSNCHHGEDAGVVCSAQQQVPTPFITNISSKPSHPPPRGTKRAKPCLEGTTRPQIPSLVSIAWSTCLHGGDTTILGYANVTEETQVRLVNGPNRCAGRVEVLHEQQWGTVCDDSWDLKDAKVVCRQLGCGTAVSAPGQAHFGRGLDPIWLDDVECTGMETTLSQCSLRSWGLHNCNHDEDVGVVCSGTNPLQLRVQGGPGPCAGRVEVLYNATWHGVCGSSWSLLEAGVVCRQLGCGPAQSAPIGAWLSRGDSRALLEGLSCRGTESLLLECQQREMGLGPCRQGSAASVVCTKPKGASPSCSVLIALLALVMLLSGVLLWLNLKRRCMAAAQAGGDSPIPVCVPSTHGPCSGHPETQGDTEMGINSVAARGQ